MFDIHPTPATRAIAFYLPQFHPTPENDRFWGKGFSEWRNVARARPRFSGHQQPHLPADLGFYDLRVAETRQAQVDLARAAGLSGFNYYHYWFSGHRVLHQPFDAVLASGDPDFPFMLTWANENWTRAWDGGNQEILLSQSYSDADTIAHARHLATAFADSRYIRIQGRPVFAVYNTDDLPCPRAWSDLFRETLLNMGFDPYLVRIERYLDCDCRPPQVLGFDAGIEFQPFSRSFRRWQRTRPDLKGNLARRIAARSRQELGRLRSMDCHFDMSAFVAFDMCQDLPDYPLFPGVTPSWDNSARRPKGQSIIFRNSTPELFSDWVASKVRRQQTGLSEDNLLFINAWNEWAEGAHLEPCLRHGHAWLDALKSGLQANQLTCIQ